MMGSDAGNHPPTANTPIFRVFLASPGDVQDERGRARAVIDQIRHEAAFRDRVNIQDIAWDQPGAEVAMDAGLTPQEAIKQGLPEPAHCDLVVVILWSRMGTPLPDEYRKADGSPYLSGTEWEYENAMAAATRPERPAVWPYRRMEKSVIEIDAPDFDEKREQWFKVKAFFKQFENPDRSIGGGVNDYETPEAFEKAFRGHLRNHLSKRFPTKAVMPSDDHQDEDNDLQKAIINYGRKAGAYHANLPVAGFATQLKVPIDIEDIYIPLRAMLDLRGVDDQRFADAAQAEKLLRGRDAGLEIPLADAFRQCDERSYRGIVILGDPGSGKTTHLKRLLLWCLRKGPRAPGAGAGDASGLPGAKKPL